MCTGGQVEIKGTDSGCWASRTTLEKRLVIVLGITLLLSVAFSVTLITYVFHSGDTKPEVCLTPGCAVASSRLIRSIDDGIDPCDDFFEYACGRWVKRHPIPDDLSSIDTFTVLRDEVVNILKDLLETSISSTDAVAIQKAKLLYRSCMNESLIEERSITEIENVIKGVLGGWPVRNASWDPNSFNLVPLLVALRRYNTQPIVSIMVRIDSKNSTRNIITLDTPGFGMPGRKYYLKSRNDTKLKAYEKLAVEMAIQMGADPKQAQKDMGDIVDLEINLANVRHILM